MKDSFKKMFKLIQIIADALRVTQVSLGSKNGTMPLSSCHETFCKNCITITCDFRLSGRGVDVFVTARANNPYPQICEIELKAYPRNCS